MRLRESELRASRASAASLEATHTQVRPEGQVGRREDVEVEANVGGAHLVRVRVKIGLGLG